MTDSEKDTTTGVTESMTARTSDWDAQTLTASAAPWLNSSARAAQSMRAVERISDTDKRRAAFARHMSEFPPLIGR